MEADGEDLDTDDEIETLLRKRVGHQKMRRSKQVLLKASNDAPLNSDDDDVASFAGACHFLANFHPIFIGFIRKIELTLAKICRNTRWEETWA
jgi:hypothetical protein